MCDSLVAVERPESGHTPDMEALRQASDQKGHTMSTTRFVTPDGRHGVKETTEDGTVIYYEFFDGVQTLRKVSFLDGQKQYYSGPAPRERVHTVRVSGTLTYRAPFSRRLVEKPRSLAKQKSENTGEKEKKHKKVKKEKEDHRESGSG